MKIEVDIDDLIQEFSLPKNIADILVANTVDAVTMEIYRNWRLEASNKLTSTRNDYVNGLQIINNNLFSKTIKLNGVLNNMIERGAAPFDMKIGFARSPKVKYSYKTDKNGKVHTSWYLTIPFRLGVPTTIGDNSAFSGIMPEDIYDIVKKRASGVGLKKRDIPAPFNIPKSRAAINIPSRSINIPEYKHKSSIYEGLQKVTSAYGKTTQNTYMTFRRVSENSDPNSWIHKGMIAHDFLNKAINATDINTISENTVDKTLANLGYGQ